MHPTLSQHSATSETFLENHAPTRPCTWKSNFILRHHPPQHDIWKTLTPSQSDCRINQNKLKNKNKFSLGLMPQLFSSQSISKWKKFYFFTCKRQVTNVLFDTVCGAASVRDGNTGAQRTTWGAKWFVVGRWTTHLLLVFHSFVFLEMEIFFKA